MSNKTKARVKDSFNLWADGSFEPSANFVGVGYIIEDCKGQVISEDGFSYKKTPESTSTIAEILSCSKALSETPVDSNIILHSDCEFIIDIFRKNDFTHRKPSIDVALKELYNQVSKHKTVRAVLEHEKHSYNLKQAHKFSVAARKFEFQSR
jgi:ribonuclease HI